MSRAILPGATEARFWAKVDRGAPDACWPWIGATNGSGYGLLYSARGKPPHKAHRLSLQMAGYDLEGAEARHTCDNPPCVNPAHLVPGTHAENMADMKSRGRARSPRGAAKSNARLTEPDVIRLRTEIAAGATIRATADKFGIEESHAAKIARGDKWAHAGGPRTNTYKTKKEATHGR